MTEKRKLYIVRRVYEGVVFAEDPQKALELASEVEKWEDHADEVEVAGGALPSGWDDSCILYANGDDVTLGEAKKLMEIAK